MASRTLNAAIVLLFGISFFFPAALSAADRVQVTGVLSEAGDLFDGELNWTVHNQSDVPLIEAELFLYPESYSDDPRVNDLLEPRLYPKGFQPAEQSLQCAHLRRASDGIVTAQLPLNPPLLPNERRTLHCPFLTRIPLKFGTFGRYRNVVTLNGGLHPHVVQRDGTGLPLRFAPPARVSHDLQVTGDDWTVLIGSHAGRDDDNSLVTPARGRPIDLLEPWVTVTAVRKKHQQNLPLRNGESISFIGKPLKPRQKKWIRRTAQHVDEILSSYGLSSRGEGLLIIEAPLRRRLVEQGSPGVILISDRYLEMSEIFWRYQDLHLAQAFFADRIQSLVAEREEPLLAPFTEHGLAWQLVSNYLEARWKDHVGLDRWLRRLSFLPQVDSLLQAPVFPFADQLFNSPWTADSLKADISRFNRPLRSGRTLFSALSDQVGSQSLVAAISQWLSPENPHSFYEILTAKTGVEAATIAASWLDEPRPLNLRIDAVVRKKVGANEHNTTIRLVREEQTVDEPGSEAPVSSPQPVEVLVKSRVKGVPTRTWLQWDGLDPVATWEIRSAGRTGSVQVDPRNRVLELDSEGISQKQDNRTPQTLKVTGYGYFLAFDPTGADLEAYGAINFRAAQDNTRHLLAQVFTDPEVHLGTGLSYVRYFGPRRIGSYRKHRLVATWDFKWLDDVRATDPTLPLSSELRLSWVFENRTNMLAPTRGQRLVISAFAGKDLALSSEAEKSLEESGYAGLDATAISLLRLHPMHSLAFRAKVGIAAGQSRQQHLDLGGTTGLRGIPKDHLRGRFRASGTVEWRHTFIRDLDVQMPLSRLRGIQGAFFVEAGAVAENLQTGPRENEVAFSLGYGLRIFGDWLGVLPAMGGIEVAWAPNSPSGKIPLPGRSRQEWLSVPVQIYIVGSQSF